VTGIEQEIIFGEIAEQPAIARARAAAARGEWPRPSGRLVITGSGDSLCAAELVARLFPGTASALPALDASSAATGMGRDDALIAISVSGRTPRVVEAAVRARRRGAVVVAVTDDLDSPLAGHADVTWRIGAAPQQALQATDYGDSEAAQYVGYHHDVAQTKSFFATLLTLAHAAGPALDDTDWDDLPTRVADLCDAAFWKPIVEVAEGCAGAGQTFFLASGAGLPLARFAAYKMFEFDRLAHFSEIEEYCHTHYFVTRPGDAVVFILQSDDDVARAREIAPVLIELFEARVVSIRLADVAAPADTIGSEVVVEGGRSPLERAVGPLLAVEWFTYLCGRVGAPDINTFHAGHDTERLIGASMRTIRRSEIRDR